MKTFLEYLQEEPVLGQKITASHQMVTDNGVIVGIIQQQAPRVFAASIKLKGRFSPIGKFSSQDMALQQIKKLLEKHQNRSQDQSRF